MAESVKCAICAEFYSDVQDDSFVVTECGHMCHSKCINAVLSQGLNCPFCRNASSLTPIRGLNPNRIPKNPIIPKNRFIITTLGDFGVGKTGIINRFTDGTFKSDQLPTVPIDFKSLIHIQVGGDMVNLSIRDTGGDYRFKGITPQYIRQAHGIIIAYDCTRWETLNSVPEWLDFANQYAPESEKILVGCKSDLKQCTCCTGNKIPCRKPTWQEVENVASSLNLFHVTTSAKTNYCVDVVFRTLASRIMENGSLLSQMDKKEKTILLRVGDSTDEGWCGLKKWFRKLWEKKAAARGEVGHVDLGKGVNSSQCN